MRVIELIAGVILLIPALLSVVLFLSACAGHDSLKTFNTFISWTGDEKSTSALPFYFGLMAIAGAYLIKDNQSRK